MWLSCFFVRGIGATSVAAMFKEQPEKFNGNPEGGLGDFVETITCRRCGREAAPKLERPPFRSDLGERVQARVCQSCWQDWLKYQTQLINHHGLDPRDPSAREFLYAQVEQ